LDARVGQLAATFASKGPFSGIVAVARDGKIISARVAGAADLEHAAPMQLDTPMRLASVSKMLTAAAVLALRDRGLVELDSPITQYLSDAPQSWSKITVRQLLAHRSGLGDYSGTPEYDARRHQPATTAGLMKMVVAVPPRFEPGADFEYCNSNYVVLGALIERVTQKNYDTAMRELVFEPLGMKSTAADSATELIAGRAVGYRWLGRRGLQHAEPLDPTNCGGSGGLRSTASDLVRFAHALSGSGFLKDDSRRQMFEAPPPGYGLGCTVGVVGDHRLIEHSGGFDGFATWLGFLPDVDVSVVVLSNIEQTRAIRFGHIVIAAAAGNAVNHDEIPDTVDYVPPLRVVSHDELLRYAGEYKCELGLLKFTIDGDHLTMQVPGEPRPEPLLPGEEPGTFLIHGPAELRLSFKDNGSQPCQSVEVSVRGKAMVGTRAG
jgi:CubicO group peptidase (beta-lactamase class C family)